MVYSREDLQKSLLYLTCRMGRCYALLSGLFKVIFVALFGRRLFLDSAAYLEPYSGVVLSLILRFIWGLIQASSFLRPGSLFREAFSVVLSPGGLGAWHSPGIFCRRKHMHLGPRSHNLQVSMQDRCEASR